MSLTMPSFTARDVPRTLLTSFDTAQAFQEPYPHWILSHVFDAGVLAALLELPFAAHALEVSGTRDVNNHIRQYFDEESARKYPVLRAVADAFQSREVVDAIERTFGTSLAQTYLRIEYAQDTDGFWLEPHTDIGPKKFTMLTYVSPDQESSCGTDVYYSKTRHCKTVPYVSNTALIFVPSSETWHGFEQRALTGVRKSVIINYVTGDWRAKEQLSFPGTPVY
jgi:hypothetical protein